MYKALRIAGEILAGGVGELTAMVLSAVLYERITGDRGSPLMGMSAAVLGSSVGVCLVGNMGSETGSKLAALTGSIVGEGGLLCCFIAGVNLDPLPGPLYFLFFLGPSPIGATIGFNLTRRYK